MKIAFAALALAACSLGAHAQPSSAASTRAEPPREFELLSKDEVGVYCANLLGNLAHSLARKGEREDLSFEFFTGQTLLIFEFAARNISDEFVKAATERYRNNKPIREAVAYCRQVGQDAHERASESNRKRAYDRAYAELKKREPQR